MEEVIEESFAENYRVKICVRGLVFIIAAVACFAVTMCGWSMYYGFAMIGLSFVFASCIGNRFGLSKSSKKVIVKNEQKDNWTGYDENFAKVVYVFLTIFIFVLWFNFKR
jgi:hypothetical protein